MLRALCRAPGVRFVVVGLAMTALHLAVLQLVVPVAVAEVANVVAFLVATQVNFLLSYFWTWRDRRPVGRESAGCVLRRAALFNGSATAAFAVNAVAFSAAHRLAALGPSPSALVATVASAAASFLLSSGVVFAHRPLLVAGDPSGPVPAPERLGDVLPGAEWGVRAHAPVTGPSSLRP